ncbi:LPS translocon maturation chaperone LptM [Variovorax sp. RHLX14]|uniref:LPS translocon maturation chaperone LptM n=1 Tax=Variovorax sp. RHLX14 TaxID=1259731 RepID=UPI003F47AE66
MLKVRQILVSAAGLFVLGVGLAGCGQKGELYLPTDPAAANRATLPSLLRPSFGDSRMGGTGNTGTATTPEPPTQLPSASPLTTPLLDDSGTLK